MLTVNIGDSIVSILACIEISVIQNALRLRSVVLLPSGGGIPSLME